MANKKRERKIFLHSSWDFINLTPYKSSMLQEKRPAGYEYPGRANLDDMRVSGKILVKHTTGVTGLLKESMPNIALW